MTSRTTPVVVCIDVEPEDRQVDASAPEWLGVEATRATSLRFVTPLEAVDALRRVRAARSTTVSA